MWNAGSVTIINALIFDGVGAELTSGAVQVVDGVIAGIGEVLDATKDTVIDAAGRTLMPGLIDAHFHAYGTSVSTFEIEAGKLSYVSLKGAKRLGAALDRGFTTVRDVAGGDIGLGNAIEEGVIRAPRYLYTGPALSQTGGHGDARPGELDMCFHGSHLGEVVDGVDNVRRAVRERFRTGAHAIKVMASGGVLSLTDPIRFAQYSAEELRAAVDEAERRGSYVAAHAYPPQAIIHAVKNGARTIEHGNLLDEESAAVMAEYGAYLVPTLVAYDSMNRRGDEVGLLTVAREKNHEVFASGLESIGIARRAGVAIGFGTDLMGPLDDDQLIGIKLQMEADGPLEVLRSATSVNAAILQRPDLGTITVGATADLVILDGNPLEDPATVWDESRPRTVIQAGVVI